MEETGKTWKVKKFKLSLRFTKHHTMTIYLLLNEAPHHEDVFGGGSTDPRILKLDTKRTNVIGQLHAIAALSLGLRGSISFG
jgi:hypothetical protein